MHVRVYMCFVWRQVCTCACMRVAEGVLTYRCIPVCVGCVCVCVYVTVARGTPTVTILLCCQPVPPTVLNRHTHTHTHTHTHNHWHSANFLLIVVCVCDDGVYKYICFTQVWSGDPLLTSEWYNLVVACSVQYLLLPDLLTTLLLCIASLFAALCLVVCAVSVCSSSRA